MSWCFLISRSDLFFLTEETNINEQIKEPSTDVRWISLGMGENWLTPNICRRSGSRKRKGMLDTCKRFGWALFSSLSASSVSGDSSGAGTSSACYGKGQEGKKAGSYTSLGQFSPYSPRNGSSKYCNSAMGEKSWLNLSKKRMNSIQVWGSHKGRCWTL